MTSVIAVLAKDQRGPCALYFLTDSQQTFLNTNKKITKTSFCKKAFASDKTPDIFCFCGEVNNPTRIIKDCIKNAFNNITNINDKHDKLIEIAIQFINSNTESRMNFTIFHGVREHTGMASVFHLWKTTFYYSEYKYINHEDSKIPIELPSEEKIVPADKYEGSGSFILNLSGSGENYIIDEKNKLLKTEKYQTTRFQIMSSLSSMNSGKDQLTGGPPQLVGLWRINNGMQFGIHWQNKLYFSHECVDNNIPENIYWFNEKFERFDPKTRQRLKDAQPHHSLKGMNI